MSPAESLAVIGEDNAWLGLSRLAEEFAEDRRWLFRGVKRESYGLLPSIGRPDTRKNLDSGDSLPFCASLEKRLFREFQRHRFAELRGLDDAAAMALGQHHGLVTRLLDWSESLFVAAYFAVEHGGAGTCEDAAIYGLRGARDLDIEAGPFDVPAKEIRIYRPPHVAARIIAQRGLFTVHGSPNQPFEGHSGANIEIRKWLIPRDETMRLKVRLDLAGFNRASLFPDLDGVAAHLSWRYKRGLLPTGGTEPSA